MTRAVVIFDVCNTLYDSNTTFEFIRFVVEKKLPNKRAFLKMLTFKLSPLFIGYTILAKLLGKDIIRSKAIRLLKGFKRAELLALADQFYQSHLQQKEIADILQLLKEQQQQKEVWLFSNSIDPVIQTIAGRLGVQYASSELEYSDDTTFTGNFKRDLSGKKQEAFFDLFQNDCAIEMMCSDNKSDLEILKLAKEPIVVIYKPSDKKYWQSLNPMFIEKF